MAKSLNLTTGSIYKQILIFFLPIFLGSLFQQLYGITDSLVVGNFVGKDALAAIDATTSLSSMFINFFVGLSSGATIIVSQYFGAKNYQNLKRAMTSALLLSTVFGLIIMVCGRMFSPYLLEVLNVPESILGMSISYIKVYFLGTVSLTVYNIASGLLRAIGDSRTPLYVLIIGTIVNIFLDILFVYFLKMGVVGAALATILSMTLTAILVVIALFNKPLEYNLELKPQNINLSILKIIVLIGLPIGFESSLYDISNVIIRSRLNTFGTDVMAAWGVFGRIDAIIWMILDAFGISLAMFVGQNFGAKKFDRVKKGLKAAIILSTPVILIMSTVIYIYIVPMTRIFVNDDAVVMAAIIMSNFLTPAFVFFVPSKMLGATIRGSGESFKPMLITLFGTCILRLVWILGFVTYNPSLELLMVSYPVTWFITSAVFIIYYQFYKKKFKVSL